VASKIFPGAKREKERVDSSMRFQFVGNRWRNAAVEAGRAATRARKDEAKQAAKKKL